MFSQTDVLFFLIGSNQLEPKSLSGSIFCTMQEQCVSPTSTQILGHPSAQKKSDVSNPYLPNDEAFWKPILTPVKGEKFVPKGKASELNRTEERRICSNSQVRTEKMSATRQLSFD